eukprot:PhF_6_TR27905/c0_g1_i3/m.40932
MAEVEFTTPHAVAAIPEYQPSSVTTFIDDARVFSVCVIPGTPIVATGGAPTGDIYLWNIRTKKRENLLCGHKAAVFNLLYCPMRCVLYSGSSDNTAIQWDPIKREKQVVYDGHRGFVVALAVIEGAREASFLTGSDDCTVKQWNTDNGDCVGTMKGHRSPVNSLVCSDAHAFAGTVEGKIFVWDIARRKQLRVLNAHAATVWCMKLLPDGRLISSSSDSKICIWDNPIVSENKRDELLQHSGKVRAMSIHGPILFTAGTDAKINVWNLNSMRLVASICKYHEKDITSMCLTCNNLVTGSFDRKINVFNVEDLLPVKQIVIDIDFVEKEEEKMKEDETKRVENMRRRVSEQFRVNDAVRAQKIRTLPISDVLNYYDELPTKTVVKSLKSKTESSRLMMELTLFVPFIISFIFFFLLQTPFEEGYFAVSTIETALRDPAIPDFRIDKRYGDLGTKRDWERWMLGVLIPTLFAGRSEPSSIPNAIGQNYLIGSLRFRTFRAVNTSCSLNTAILDSTVFKECYGELNQGFAKTPYVCAFNQCDPKADRSALLTLLKKDPAIGFNYTDPPNTLQTFGHLRASYPSGGYIVDLPLTATLNEALAFGQALIDTGYVDTVATRFVGVSFIQYNPFLDGFVSSFFYMESTQGGAWLPYSKSNAVYTFDRDNVGKLAFEAYFMSFVLYFLFRYIARGFRAARKGKGLEYLFDSWSLMELANIMIFIAMYIYRVQWFTACIAHPIVIPTQDSNYQDGLEYISDVYVYQVWLNGLNTVLTFLNLLKFVRLNDRLNVLTRTIAAAQESLAGVLIIFVYIVFAFSLMGNALYGVNVFKFRSLDSSYNSLLRMLVGDFDYDEMRVENEAITLFFFWSYHILCLFIMLNFIAAILGDAFDDTCAVCTPVPLDKAIVKTAKDALQEILPKSLARKIVLLRHRKSQTLIVEKLYETICEQQPQFQPLLDGAEEDEIDDDSKITRDEFLTLLDSETVKVASPDFIMEVWRDLAWERHYKLLNETEQEKHEHQEFMLNRIEVALKPLMEVIANLEGTAGKLESMVQDIAPFAELAASGMGSGGGGGDGGGGGEVDPFSGFGKGSEIVQSFAFDK